MVAAATLFMHNTSWTAAGVVALAGVWLGRPADGPRARRLALLAVGCWLAGQVVWDVWALAGARPGVPSPADLFWLGSAVISLWIVHSGPSGDGAWRTLARLDLAAILVGSVALSSVLLYADLERSELAVPGLMTAVAYPALYGAVAVKLAHRMSASAFRAPGVLLVLVGLASEAVAFSLRAPLLLDGATTSSDTAIDVLAPLGLVLIGCGAALTRREAAAVALSSERRERATLRGGAAPGIAFAALLLSLPILALEAQPLGQRLIAQGAVIALGAILALRFTMLSVRHLRLAERERVAREEAQRSSAARRVLEQERERSRVEAELANLAKSEFMSRMSHELRTPLNAILGFGQILEMDGPEAADPENVRHILRGGRHLLGLVDEILDISRIESGKMTLALEPIDLGTTIRDVVSLIKPLAAERGISLTVEEAHRPQQFVMADRQRLRQVLLNLLSNAVKYNRDGGSVEIRCAVTGAGARDGAPPRAQIHVSDTGIGIAPAHLDKLFSPFDRLGAERTGVEGTGLGLALSQRLMTLMDGNIVASSDLGAGSTFVVELPGAANPVAPAVVDEARWVRPSTILPGEHSLLCIEDNHSNLRLIQQIFGSQPGIHLLSAMLGRVGIELAEQHRPDLILLDLHLPDITGAEALRLLKDDARTRDIPVVILSADATGEQVGRLRQAGAADYLTKPLDVARLLEVVATTVKAPA